MLILCGVNKEQKIMFLRRYRSGGVLFQAAKNVIIPFRILYNFGNRKFYRFLNRTYQDTSKKLLSILWKLLVIALINKLPVIWTVEKHPVCQRYLHVNSTSRKAPEHTSPDPSARFSISVLLFTWHKTIRNIHILMNAVFV